MTIPPYNAPLVLVLLTNTTNTLLLHAQSTKWKVINYATFHSWNPGDYHRRKSAKSLYLTSHLLPVEVGSPGRNSKSQNVDVLQGLTSKAWLPDRRCLYYNQHHQYIVAANTKKIWEMWFSVVLVPPLVMGDCHFSSTSPKSTGQWLIIGLK